MDRLGGAYLYARPDQLDASREQQNHVVDHMEMIVVRESCTAYLFFRMTAAAFSTFDRFWLVRDPVDKKKNREKKDIRENFSVSHSFHERWTRPSRSTMLLLRYTSSNPLLFLSLFPPPTFFSAQSHYGWDLYGSSSRSCSSCLFLTRPVLPRDHCFLGPRCCQIVRGSHGRKASTVLHSLALSPLPISLCLYKSSCIYTNLAILIHLELISI